MIWPKEAIEAEHPGVLHRLSEDPNVRRALYIIVAVYQACVPLYQPLQVHVMTHGQGGLHRTQILIAELEEACMSVMTLQTETFVDRVLLKPCSTNQFYANRGQ